MNVTETVEVQKPNSASMSLAVEGPIQSEPSLLPYITQLEEMEGGRGTYETPTNCMDGIAHKAIGDHISNVPDSALVDISLDRTMYEGNPSSSSKIAIGTVHSEGNALGLGNSTLSQSPVSTTSTGSDNNGPRGFKQNAARQDIDAKSSALKALAGIGRVVSRSRQVDAEALQAIKAQRARAKAEGGSTSGTHGTVKKNHERNVSSDSMPDLMVNTRGHVSHACYPSKGTSRPQHRRSHSSLHPPTSQASLPLTSPGAYREFLAGRTLQELLALQKAVEVEISRHINTSLQHRPAPANSMIGQETPVSPPPVAASNDSFLSAHYAAKLLGSHEKVEQDQAVALQKVLSALGHLNARDVAMPQSYRGKDNKVPSPSGPLNMRSSEVEKESSNFSVHYSRPKNPCDGSIGDDNKGRSMASAKKYDQRDDLLMLDSLGDFSFLGDFPSTGTDAELGRYGEVCDTQDNSNYYRKDQASSPSKSISHVRTSSSSRPPRPQPSNRGIVCYGNLHQTPTGGSPKSKEYLGANSRFSLFPNPNQYIGLFNENNVKYGSNYDGTKKASGSNIWL